MPFIRDSDAQARKARLERMCTQDLVSISPSRITQVAAALLTEVRRSYRNNLAGWNATRFLGMLPHEVHGDALDEAVIENSDTLYREIMRLTGSEKDSSDFKLEAYPLRLYRGDKSGYGIQASLIYLPPEQWNALTLR